MTEQHLLTAGLGFVMIFVAWSCLLYLFGLLVSKTIPKMSNWSRFWQLLCALTLLPLLPIAVPQQASLIPQVLKQAVVDAQTQIGATTQTLSNHSSAFNGLNGAAWLLMSLVLIGCGYGLWRFSTQMISMNRAVKRANLRDNFEGFSKAQQAFIKDKNIQVRQSPLPVSPFVYGFFKLNLMLPDYVFDLPEQQRLLLIEHELTHIKRYDPQAMIGLRLLACVCWFNPFIRAFTEKFNHTMELNCDAQVIAHSPHQKSTYVRTLIASLKMSKSCQTAAFNACFSGRHSSAKDLQHRIKAAMSDTQMAYYGPVFQMALTLVCTLCISFVVVAKSDLSTSPVLTHDSMGYFPVDSDRVTSRFNIRNIIRDNKPHKGIDIAADIGSDVLSSFDGIVQVADDVSLHKNYGKVILVDNGQGRKTVYAHLNSFDVAVGQSVVAGQKLGTVGMTGRATGPHLHFEVLEQGKNVDPEHYLKQPRK